MAKLHFSIIINAPREKVWNTMLEDATYREWTAEFNPGGYYEGSWDQGAEIKFLGAEEDGTLSGMFGKIAENRPYEFVSIEYTGAMMKGAPITEGEYFDQIIGSHENYTFKDVEGGTEVQVDVDVTERDRPYLEPLWPKALQKLKEIAER